MSFADALLVLLVSHIVGDVLLQTEWQARTKALGLGDASGRRALAAHLCTYVLAFVPALVWIGVETSAVRAVAVGAFVALTHLLIDDGRLVVAWLENVKHAHNPPLALAIAVDQSLHVVCLLGAAVIASI
ncbi:MAG TPA: DUF3307 domain-containing protein [Solirubrobacteraceae bacterium]|nr:DUF3307 domain-containing protein [Solirubrobacteraceae bacterium]